MNQPATGQQLRRHLPDVLDANEVGEDVMALGRLRVVAEIHRSYGDTNAFRLPVEEASGGHYSNLVGASESALLPWESTASKSDRSPVRRRGSSSSATLRSGGAPNSAPSLCSVAGLLVAKRVPPTRTLSAFPRSPSCRDTSSRLCARSCCTHFSPARSTHACAGARRAKLGKSV